MQTKRSKVMSVCHAFYHNFFFYFSGKKIHYSLKSWDLYGNKIVSVHDSHKEPYAILVGPDGFFWPCSGHRVRPSYRDFFNSFAMKAHAGPYGSYDK